MYEQFVTVQRSCHRFPRGTGLDCRMPRRIAYAAQRDRNKLGPDRPSTTRFGRPLSMRRRSDLSRRTMTG